MGWNLNFIKLYVSIESIESGNYSNKLGWKCLIGMKHTNLMSEDTSYVAPYVAAINWQCIWLMGAEIHYLVMVVEQNGTYMSGLQV